MSGICSRHPYHDPDCRMCNADIRDVFPDYDEKKREAEEAGEVDCGHCGFRFYRTTETCPLCGTWTWTLGGDLIFWPFHTPGHEGYGKKEWIGVYERRVYE